MFREMPAIISLDNTVSSVWNIPFPAVTICSANRVRPSVYNNLNNTKYKDEYKYDFLTHEYNECFNNI